jgi:SNF family Na+-dependent transporter
MELSSRRSNPVSSTFFIAAGDTLVAVLAGFVVFPLAFSFGLEPGAGPGLSLAPCPSPLLNCREVIGLLWDFSFFSASPAITSSISLLEVASAYFIDEQGWSRSRAGWTLGPRSSCWKFLRPLANSSWASWMRCQQIISCLLAPC